ncbi:MAG: ester cyclase [Pyrinomonadaceae bacterium]|nr:ester cyclase [Pyrinomonadaceae bacterium]
MNKNSFDAFVAAWNEGNLEALDEHIVSNFVRRVPETMNKNANNLAELKERISDFRKAFPDLKVTIEDAQFLENRSVAQWTFTGTNTGPGDHPPTGKAVSVPGVSLHRYEDGKILEEDVYFDVLGFMAQLGIVKLPEAAASA